ncbi:MAG: cofactor-independent phosphoglycerate mutase [Oscillospiraceae bacterium]|jgi:2,3-bisphosphoglycerate-independent phosphoglycerate mutase|nr:cofactor-independent phosphoglycerate mutase [Oscillospiraceae bacterium]
MKYIVLLCDGMSDTPNKKLGGKTPMELAHKPNIDKLFLSASHYGKVKTIPTNLNPGSDVANMSVLGFAPDKYYTGRSPLEAVSMGIELDDNDIALRANLVTISDEPDFADKRMLDYCGGDVSTKDARILIEYLANELNHYPLFADSFALYSGVSYRHCLVWKNSGIADNEVKYVGFTPPHDFSGGKLADEVVKADHLNKVLLDIMVTAQEILKDAPAKLNMPHIKANALWLWGAGKKCLLPNFTEKTGKKGAVVSAVDLLKGIAKSAGMDASEVEGATGYLDTNFAGKAEAAINALKNGADYVYLHIEAPDECGHRGEADGKIRAIELIDEKVLEPILSAFEDGELKDENFRILVCPDHPTPLETKTHSRSAVPFFIFTKGDENTDNDNGDTFTEQAVIRGTYVGSGEQLSELLLSDK